MITLRLSFKGFFRCSPGYRSFDQPEVSLLTVHFFAETTEQTDLNSQHSNISFLGSKCKFNATCLVWFEKKVGFVRIEVLNV